MPIAQDHLLTFTQNRLRTRQHEQLLNRPLDEQLPLCSITAMTILPHPHPRPRNGGWAIQKPLQPIDAVIVCVLSRHPGEDDDGTPVVRHVVSGFSADLNFITGEVLWGGQDGLMFAYDLGRPLDIEGPDPLGAELPGVPFSDVNLITLALDMDLACWYAMSRSEYLPLVPGLPPVVLGFAPGTEFKPESTRAVRQLAANRDLPVDLAWRCLAKHLRIPDELNGTELTLVDARLTHRRGGQDGLPGVLQVFHDLRGVLGPQNGRRVDNPARMLSQVRMPNPAGCVLHDLQLEGVDLSSIPADQLKQIILYFRERLGRLNVLFADADIVQALSSAHSHIHPHRVCASILRKSQDVQTVAETMRLLLPTRVKNGCTDIDLDLAMATPNKPLVASMLPRIQLWRVPAENPLKAFKIVDRVLGVQTDFGIPNHHHPAAE